MSHSPCIARPSSCYSFLFAVVANIIPQLLAKPAVRLQVSSLDYLKVILMTELKASKFPPCSRSIAESFPTRYASPNRGTTPSSPYPIISRSFLMDLLIWLL